ncbi:hypothetical protein JDV02_010047 [Purpureocillium takamizusanense]|uniref:Uncharacterized protein n=1 Tax=Purpureocillium takamizusanense TaxID=2060973 RepID=A0A9Q8VGV8_9HYPO|nr:uncharacterized protein JDV02_010047 [Purpureocillium takamizusanense]UNI24289.1 hypothetical protein JDV02_010047 [Purpureocillium takamizusanense]
MAGAVRNTIFNPLVALLENVVSSANDASTPEATGVLTPVLAGFIQSTLRQKTLSFEPFAVDFLQTMLGMREISYRAFRGNPQPVLEFFDALHVTVRGKPLHRMNANALSYISCRLDAMKGTREIPVENLYLWLRELMTMATTTALMGQSNPLLQDATLVEDL